MGMFSYTAIEEGKETIVSFDMDEVCLIAGNKDNFLILLKGGQEFTTSNDEVFENFIAAFNHIKGCDIKSAPREGVYTEKRSSSTWKKNSGELLELCDNGDLDFLKHLRDFEQKIHECHGGCNDSNK